MKAFVKGYRVGGIAVCFGVIPSWQSELTGEIIPLKVMWQVEGRNFAGYNLAGVIREWFIARRLQKQYGRP